MGIAPFRYILLVPRSVWLDPDRYSSDCSKRGLIGHARMASDREGDRRPDPHRNEHMPDEHKTLEQRIADIEFNLKKLREEITNAYISWEGKIVLEQSPTQTPDQPKQPPAQPKKKP